MDATEEKKDGEIKKTRRQQFEERMQTRYPDMDLADEEAFYGRINDDYDDYEGFILQPVHIGSTLRPSDDGLA